MTELLPLSIGIGLVVSLVFTELFGVAAGGMIVPGYLALGLGKPLDALATVAAGLVTFAIVHTLSSFTIVYGRRRTVLMILVGYLVATGVRALGAGTAAGAALDLAVIGYIVPGLIAIWLDRQGILETIAALATASAVVRLVLVVLVGVEVRG
ncbi:MAG: poly-gamma-glutamate biosynthesis protein PgsC [Polyangiaceae bacterium]|nr:poly-gamma-glutamate biosynthesis protein PgsC [Polyangiaceae bacterium]